MMFYFLSILLAAALGAGFMFAYLRNHIARGSLYEVPVGNSNKHINKGEPADVESVLKAIESVKPVRRTKRKK